MLSLTHPRGQLETPCVEHCDNDCSALCIDRHTFVSDSALHEHCVSNSGI